MYDINLVLKIKQMPLWRIALCSVKGIIKTIEYEKEVTWTRYIDLTDAVANKLLELKAYWWCTQASTPTPSTPVDIVCNNWALKVKDKELPVWYVRLASIGFAGSTYYDTDEKLYGTDTISMKIYWNQATWMNCFGAYTGTGTWNLNYSLYVYFHNSNQCYLRYWDTLYRPVLWTGPKTITFWPWATTWFSTNVTITADTFESTDAAYIWALPNSSSAKFNGTFYWNIEVSDTNGTRLKWIPCKRKSDGVIWYYEVVNWNFLEPVWDTPTAWAEDYSNIEVYVVSDTWVISVNSSRCLFGVKLDWNAKWIFKVKAGQTITVKAKIDNLWSYLVLYNSETLGSTTYIKRIAFSASELVDWYYTKTVVSDTDWYAIFQWTQDYATMQANDRKANIPCVEKVWYSGWATATCEDLLWVWDYKDEQEILSGDVITKVGVAVLTWEEEWWYMYDANNVFRLEIDWCRVPTEDTWLSTNIICNQYQVDARTNANMVDNSCKLAKNSSLTYWWLYIKSTTHSTLSAFKSFLASQLAAWTPVIVVYPLATPTTLSVAWQSLSIPAWDSRIEIVEWSILNLPLYAKYKSTTE